MAPSVLCERFVCAVCFRVCENMDLLVLLAPKTLIVINPEAIWKNPLFVFFPFFSFWKHFRKRMSVNHRECGG